MKKIAVFSALLLLLFLLFSCEKPTMLSINQTALTFDNGGGNQSVAITANKMWTTSSNQGWLRVSPPSGEGSASISVSCEANTTYDSRTGTITIKSEELSQTISVTQAEGQGLLVSQAEYNLSNEAQTISVEVQANVQYTVDIDAACRDWIKQNSTKALSSNTIKFDISKNEAYDGREGKITIKQSNGSLSATVVVKQSQTNGLLVDQTAYDISYEEQQLAIKVKANVDYDVQIDDSCKEWISRVGTKGLTESTVTLAIAKNEDVEREGKVILKYGSLQEAVKIKQGGGFVEFEDENFKTYCVNHFDINGDGKISINEAERVTNLSIGRKNISSLVGISYFKNLDTLDCFHNQLTSLDVSNNTALKVLYCDDNQLTTLDVSHNSSLTKLLCGSNQFKTLNISNTTLKHLSCHSTPLTTLDVSNAIALEILICSGNQLTTLDVSHNAELKELSCGGNQLTSLDVSHNSALELLSCENTPLTTLDVSHNTALKKLSCNNTPLTTLDVSNNAALESLSCSGNQLTTLEVSHNSALQKLYCDKNKLTALDVSHNSKLTYLSCINNQLTALDVNNNPSLNTLICTNNQLTSLNVSNDTALEILSCGDNQLTSLDVSPNTALTRLICKNNLLTTLDVSNNTALGALSCENNKLVKLDVSSISALIILNCNDNLLTTLDVSDNSALVTLDCYNNPNLLTIWLETGQTIQTFRYDTDVAQICYVDGVISFEDANFKAYCVQNFDTDGDGEISMAEAKDIIVIDIDTYNVSSLQGIENMPNLRRLFCHGKSDKGKLTSLDVSHNMELRIIVCNDNRLTSLDVSNNIYLARLECQDNQLTSLDVSNNTALEDLDCYGNQLTSLDVSNNTGLVTLYCYSNQLTSLDFSKNTALWWVQCYNNQLTSLDVSNNTALEELNCYGNQLTRLDVSQNTALLSLNCDNNQLTSLDVSNNMGLEVLDCGGNQLTSLDVSKNTSLRFLNCANNQLTSLNTNQNTALTILSCGWNRLTSLDVTKNTVLNELYCAHNQLTNLDVSNNSMLSKLYCYYNPYLTEIWLKTNQTISDFRYDKDIATIKYKVIPEAVDLGLSVKWATFNVGASSPEEYGDYFAWGEVEPYYSSQDPLTWKDGKTGYTWDSYKWCNGSEESLTKYNTSAWRGTVDNKTVLEAEDDVVHVKLGGSWRMPTVAEWTELRENCTWTWTTQNGVNGRLVTSNKNGNSIFLPAAGTWVGPVLNGAGSNGYYWSSSLFTDDPSTALDVNFNSSYVSWRSVIRECGRSVRPVCE